MVIERLHDSNEALLKTAEVIQSVLRLYVFANDPCGEIEVRELALSRPTHLYY